jgi:hypothetical protein
MARYLISSARQTLQHEVVYLDDNCISSASYVAILAVPGVLGLSSWRASSYAAQTQAAFSLAAIELLLRVGMIIALEESTRAHLNRICLRRIGGSMGESVLGRGIAVWHPHDSSAA